jgi:hypothetical protein
MDREEEIMESELHKFWRECIEKRTAQLNCYVDTLSIIHKKIDYDPQYNRHNSTDIGELEKCISVQKDKINWAQRMLKLTGG